DILELPESGQQAGAAGLDPFPELPAIGKGENGDAAELGALVAARRGIDDGLSIAAALTHPEAAGVREHAARRRRAENLRFEPLRMLLEDRGNRIVNRCRQHAEDQ